VAYVVFVTVYVSAGFTFDGASISCSAGAYMEGGPASSISSPVDGRSTASFPPSPLSCAVLLSPQAATTRATPASSAIGRAKMRLATVARARGVRLDELAFAERMLVDDGGELDGRVDVDERPRAECADDGDHVAAAEEDAVVDLLHRGVPDGRRGM